MSLEVQWTRSDLPGSGVAQGYPVLDKAVLDSSGRLHVISNSSSSVHYRRHDADTGDVQAATNSASGWGAPPYPAIFASPDGQYVLVVGRSSSSNYPRLLFSSDGGGTFSTSTPWTFASGYFAQAIYVGSGVFLLAIGANAGPSRVYTVNVTTGATSLIYTAPSTTRWTGAGLVQTDTGFTMYEGINLDNVCRIHESSDGLSGWEHTATVTTGQFSHYTRGEHAWGETAGLVRDSVVSGATATSLSGAHTMRNYRGELIYADAGSGEIRAVDSGLSERVLLSGLGAFGTISAFGTSVLLLPYLAADNSGQMAFLAEAEAVAVSVFGGMNALGRRLVT